MADHDYLSDQGYRLDGRKQNELRRIQCKMGVFEQADGSAYFEQGNTKVLATVYGPHEVRGSRSKALRDSVLINCEYSVAAFGSSERKRRGRGDKKSLEVALEIKKTFDAALLTHLYPKSQLDLYVQVLQSDGSDFSVCINALTLALVDAGIPMKDLMCSATCMLADDVPLVDINYVEESSSVPQVIVATLPKLDQEMVFLSVSGRLHEDHLSKVLDATLTACNEIQRLLERFVREHISSVMANKGPE